MWSRVELKARAKAVLKISYWKAFLVSLVIGFAGGSSGGSFSWNFGSGKTQNLNISGSGSEVLLYLLIFILIFFVVLFLVLAFRIFLGYPLEVGGRRYFVQAGAEDTYDLNALGFVFEKSRYSDVLKAMLWRGFLNFLWYLLLIIPGIVKAYAYSMVPYILADNPNIGYKRAVELSVQMTDGQKLDMWILDLSFIGWYLLGILALFIGVLFVMPYYNATIAELYLVLRQHALDKGLCRYEELGLNSTF